MKNLFILVIFSCSFSSFSRDIKMVGKSTLSETKGQKCEVHYTITDSGKVTKVYLFGPSVFIGPKDPGRLFGGKAKKIEVLNEDVTYPDPLYDYYSEFSIERASSPYKEKIALRDSAGIIGSSKVTTSVKGSFENPTEVSVSEKIRFAFSTAKREFGCSAQPSRKTPSKPSSRDYGGR